MENVVIVAKCHEGEYFDPNQKHCVEEPSRETVLSYTDCPEAAEIQCESRGIFPMDDYIPYEETEDCAANCYVICSALNLTTWDLLVICQQGNHMNRMFIEPNGKSVEGIEAANIYSVPQNSIYYSHLPTEMKHTGPITSITTNASTILIQSGVPTTIQIQRGVEPGVSSKDSSIIQTHTGLLPSITTNGSNIQIQSAMITGIPTIDASVIQTQPGFISGITTNTFNTHIQSDSIQGVAINESSKQIQPGFNGHNPSVNLNNNSQYSINTTAKISNSHNAESSTMFSRTETLGNAEVNVTPLSESSGSNLISKTPDTTTTHHTDSTGRLQSGNLNYISDQNRPPVEDLHSSGKEIDDDDEYNSVNSGFVQPRSPTSTEKTSSENMVSTAISGDKLEPDTQLDMPPPSALQTPAEETKISPALWK